MKRMTFIATIVTIIMVLNCVFPILSAFATENASNTITLNSELYTAVSKYMKSHYSGFSYNDSLRTITATNGDFNSVETLDLKESAIDNIEGLQNFKKLKKLVLAANYLTLDSNLEVINELSDLEYLDLSTNQINGFSWLTLEDISETHFHSQFIEDVQLVTLTDEDYENGYVKREVEGLLGEIDLESNALDVNVYYTDGKKWDTTNGQITKAYENTTHQRGTEYLDYEENVVTLKKLTTMKSNGYMYHVSAIVTDSHHKYCDSEINLYYILTDEDERGIIFKDENFYKCVKAQLTKGQTRNPDLGVMTPRPIYTSSSLDGGLLEFGNWILRQEQALETNIQNYYSADIINEMVHSGIRRIDYGEYSLMFTVDGSYSEGVFRGYTYSYSITRNERISYLERNLYQAAYDRALTLVIKIDDLRNRIVSLIIENEKVKDLTGLQEFIGLQEKLNISYNYIDTIEKVIELEENKKAEEQKIREEIGKLISKMSSETVGMESSETLNCRATLKAYIDLVDEYNKLYAKTDRTEADNNKLTQLSEQISQKESTVRLVIDKLNSICDSMEATWENSYKCATIQTAELYNLSNDDIAKIETKEEALSILINELQKIKTLEGEKATDSYIDYVVGLIENVTSLSIPTSENNTPITDFFSVYSSEDLKERLSLGEMKELLQALKTADQNVFTTLSSVFQTFNLSSCRKLYEITGRLTTNNTSEMLEAVIKLPRLKILNASINNIEDINELGNLTDIEEVDFSDNLIITIDDVEWANLDKIKVLKLSKNPISNISILKDYLPEVRKLYFANCLLSGKFDFDFIRYYSKLNYITFYGNYFTDLSMLIDNYAGGLRKSNCDCLAEYIRQDKGIDFDFGNQKITINYGSVNTKDGDNLLFTLPPIFANVEEIDPYNTTFGVIPADGIVDETGKTLILPSFVNGRNYGKVTIDTVSYGTNNRTEFSVGSGTVCNIVYDVTGLSDSSNPGSDPSNPTPGGDDQDNPNDDNNDEEKELTDEELLANVKIDTNNNYILVAKPGLKETDLEKALNLLNYRITSKGTAKNGKVYTTYSLGMYENNDNPDEITIDGYEVVMLGDIDGDGDVDSLDSGYARALRYGNLFANSEDSEDALEEYKETANYRAANINGQGQIEKEDTRAILWYRAGLIDSFSVYLRN